MQGMGVFPDEFKELIFEPSPDSPIWYQNEFGIVGGPIPIITQYAQRGSRNDDKDESDDKDEDAPLNSFARRKHARIILAKTPEDERALEQILRAAGQQELNFNGLLVSDFALTGGGNAYNHMDGVVASPTYVTFAVPVMLTRHRRR
jgi:hypothetical protein